MKSFEDTMRRLLVVFVAAALQPSSWLPSTVVAEPRSIRLAEGASDLLGGGPRGSGRTLADHVCLNGRFEMSFEVALDVYVKACGENC